MAKRFSLLFIFAAFYGILIKAALSPSLPSPSTPIILYSNQHRHDLRLVLKKSFEKASQSIHVWMYAITDPLLLRLLQKKADAGVHVELAFDKKGGTPSLPDSLHPQIPKTRGLMHKKIVILDDEVFFLGSANMTTSSLQIHDNLSIGVCHKGAAGFLKNPAQNSYAFQIDQTEGALWLLPDLNALSEVKKEIDAAQSSIFVAMFTLTQKDLIEALIAAHKRGVAVTLALDRYTANGASKKAVQKLSAEGIPIFVSVNLPLLHHKWAYIDRATLILGSTNWTESAFRKNGDVLLFLRNLPPSIRSQMQSLTSTIQMESNSSL